jgi:hypothetical protein
MDSFSMGLGASLQTFNPAIPQPPVLASHLLLAPLKPLWIGVRPRFEQFQRELALTSPQVDDGTTKRAGVVNCLNHHYHSVNSETDNSFFIGSWGKQTAIRPPRDVDIYFLLPPAVYHRFQNYVGNRQSALLQEVKNVISKTYPNTDMSGDGQIVLVGFGSYAVEVVPAFHLTNGNYWICDTNNGGSYKETNPPAEAAYIEQVDAANNRNLRPLIRMLKAWQSCCSVPLKSFQLELVAAAFIQQSPWRDRSIFWYDWIVRDFSLFLYRAANKFVTIVSTHERILLGDAWQSRALSAYNRAVKACEFEYQNLVISAGEEWQKIFGTQIPRSV